jgi:hypothetical protein
VPPDYLHRYSSLPDLSIGRTPLYGLALSAPFDAILSELIWMPETLVTAASKEACRAAAGLGHGEWLLQG